MSSTQWREPQKRSSSHSPWQSSLNRDLLSETLSQESFGKQCDVSNWWPLITSASPELNTHLLNYWFSLIRRTSGGRTLTWSDLSSCKLVSQSLCREQCWFVMQEETNWHHVRIHTSHQHPIRKPNRQTVNVSASCLRPSLLRTDAARSNLCLFTVLTELPSSFTSTRSRPCKQQLWALTSPL